MRSVFDIHIKSIPLIFGCLFISFAAWSFVPASMHLNSPDKKIVFEFDIREGKPGYSVLYEGRRLIDFSYLNIVFKNGSLQNGVSLEHSVRLDSGEHYTLMTGRSGAVNDSFHQVRLFLKELHTPRRIFILQVRAFNRSYHKKDKCRCDNGVRYSVICRWWFCDQTGENVNRQIICGFYQ